MLRVVWCLVLVARDLLSLFVVCFVMLFLFCGLLDVVCWLVCVVCGVLCVV